MSIEIWLPILIFRWAILKMFKIKIEVVAGSLLYGAGLIIIRLARLGYGSTVALFKKTPSIPIRPSRPEGPLDVNSHYRLRDLQVVLSGGPRPLRIDLDAYHTILAGATGSGKTCILNWIIAQLVARGEEFLGQYDLYLLDLKSSRRDYLEMWKPVIAGYYPIDESGSSEAAIAALEEITRKMQSGKRKVVFIDELSMLTRSNRGGEVLDQLAAQLRDSGALFVATQRPHYNIVARSSTSNLERKICLRMDDKEGARLVLRHTPASDATTLRRGEFILKEPGARNNEQIGRSMLMKLPGDIDKVVMNIIEARASSDPRLGHFTDVSSNLKQGAGIPGIHRIAPNSSLSAEQIRDFRRNFAKSGAFHPIIGKNGKVTGYQLARPFAEAFDLVVDYIREGQWESGPETVGKKNV